MINPMNANKNIIIRNEKCVMSLLKRIYWRTLRSLRFKKKSWDVQYKEGKWCGLQQSPHTVQLAAKLCHGGKIVHLGCGETNLPAMMPPGSFSEYIGIDISGIAIELSQANAEKSGIKSCTFQQGDMAKWEGTDSVSLILLEECLYYLSLSEAKRFLIRCSKSLSIEGYILCIIHSAKKFETLIELCHKSCKVVDEITINGRVYMSLRPK